MIAQPVRIVLVEPAGDLNVGSVARVMKNFGLEQLWLVNPRCDPLSDGARRMAVHAGDVLEAAAVVGSLPEALVGCQRAIGTVGRISSGDLQPLDPISGLRWLTASGTGAIVFGTEDRGLNKVELQYCQQTLTIPSVPVYPSLNLAQAVAICCYQLRLFLLDENPIESGSQASRDLLELASIEAHEAFYEQLEAGLLLCGYLYPHTAFSRMQKLRKVFQKANMTETEVTMLRGMLSQFQWAIANQKRKDP